MDIPTPIKSRVLIKDFPIEDQTESGLYLPEQAAKRPSEGIVFAVGSDVKEVKVGDRVIHSRYAFQKFVWEDIEYILIDEGEILTKVLEE